MGSFFSSKKTEPEFKQIDTPQSLLGGDLSKWLQGQIGKSATQYSGDRVAGMSPYETQSLDFLSQFANQGESKSTQTSKEFYQDLVGQYKDPASNPYYQAVKASAARTADEGMKDIASQAAGGGRYWSGARLGEQGNFMRDVNLGLNETLSKLSLDLQSQRQKGADSLAQLGQAEEQRPLQQAAALQQYGALPRQLQQAQQDATFAEWMRATQQYPMDIAKLASGVQTEPTFAQYGYQPSPFSQVAGPLGTLAGALLALPTGGVSLGLGAALGGAGGSLAGNLGGQGGDFRNISMFKK